MRGNGDTLEDMSLPLRAYLRFRFQVLALRSLGLRATLARSKWIVFLMVEPCEVLLF